VAEGGLQLGVVEVLGAQPALVLAGPAGPSPVDPAVPQQEGLEPPASPAAVIVQVGAGPAQVPDRFLTRGGDADGDQLAGAVQARQAAAVAPVGLDLVPGRSGDERWRDHLAGDPLAVQQPGQLIAGRAGLIADPQAAGFGEAAEERQHGRLVAGDLLHRRRGSIRWQGGDRDGVAVHVQPEVDRSGVRDLCHGGRLLPVVAPPAVRRG
jgi:hypothetical protein